MKVVNMKGMNVVRNERSEVGEDERNENGGNESESGEKWG